MAEAEQLLNQHAAIREEIDGYAEDYNKMRAMGDRVTQDQTDPQYMFLRQVCNVTVITYNNYFSVSPDSKKDGKNCNECGKIVNIYSVKDSICRYCYYIYFQRNYVYF